MNLNQLTKDSNHCTHGSLTSKYGWLIQIILASAAFTCLIGIFLNILYYKFKFKFKSILSFVS